MCWCIIRHYIKLVSWNKIYKKNPPSSCCHDNFIVSTTTNRGSAKRKCDQAEMEALSVHRSFLRNCSESLILDHGRSALPNEKSTDLQDILTVHLNSLLLKNLKELGRCKALKICILADNFLTRMDPLVECVNLVKLDLNGNQVITRLPNPSFWNNLKDLQLLNLHDNNIAEIKSIASLSNCLKLTALTLYDTPLSLKHNYRHSVVNSIWSLKALDNRIISDEEIVENWHLPSKFNRMAPHFYVNLYPSSETNSFQAEMKVMQEIITVINRTQANYCPILIIQKWIRGHLTRKRLGLYPHPQPLILFQRQVTPTCAQPYPQSPEISTSSWIKECKTDQLVSKNLDKRDSVVKNLYVSLSKLEQADSTEMLQETMNPQSFDGRNIQNLRMPCNTPNQSDNGKPCDGNLNESDRDKMLDEGMDTENFHLFCYKANMYLSEPFADMVISRKTAGQEVREAIDHFHLQKPDNPSRTKPCLPKISAEKSFVGRPTGRCHDCFSLVPFRAIEKAYWAREKAQDLKEREARVTELQACRDYARGCRDNFMEGLRREALLQQDRDKAEMEKALSLQKAKYEQKLQLAHQKHLRFQEEKRRRVLGQEMVIHFSRQHNSLAKTITRHCIQLRLSNAQQEKRKQVAVSKEHTEAQKLLIQRYLENRKHFIHAEDVASRISMRTSLAQKQHCDLLTAQARVAQIKSSHYEVEVLRPVQHKQAV